MRKAMPVESDFAREITRKNKNRHPTDAARIILAYQKEVLRLQALVRFLLKKESEVIAETLVHEDQGSLALRVQKIILSPESQ